MVLSNMIMPLEVVVVAAPLVDVPPVDVAAAAVEVTNLRSAVPLPNSFICEIN